MKCPNCNSYLSISSVGSAECDGEYLNYFEGSCYNCGKSYEWTNVYEFTYITQLHEIDENDHL